ncbi:MAG: alpha/beta hydrolase [Pseudomonadota bacterium]
MSAPSFLDTVQGRRIAYHRADGDGPGIVFLGGFKSDMEGTKATHLEAWCRTRGQAFLRFDYSGHGASSGRFEDGAISDWAEDARAALEELTDGPQLLIGSSMGGWISLLMAKRIPEKVAALVTIAAAPDFTEDGFWAGFSDADRATLLREGQIAVPSDYGEPYIITKRLIEDGRDNFVLREPLDLPFPTRFLQGTDDADVPLHRATTLLEHVEGPDIRLVVLKGADHSFSSPPALKVLEDATLNALAAIKTA